MRILTTGFAAAAILLGTTALTTPAFATGNNNNGPSQNCNGNGSCSSDTYEGDTYNKGGEGGDVGDITVKPEIKAYGGDAEQDQKQKQKQDQDQKQKQKQDQDQDQDQDQKQKQSIKNAGNSKNEIDNENSNNSAQEVSVNTYNERAPVNTAYAPGLSTGEDTCMGSSSIGAQAVSFGLSVGTTWQDDNCRRLKNSRQMVALGYPVAAIALMCVDADVVAAMAQAGTPCPNAQNRESYYAPLAVPVAAAPPTRVYATMAPVDDAPARTKRARKLLPPK